MSLWLSLTKCKTATAGFFSVIIVLLKCYYSVIGSVSTGLN